MSKREKVLLIIALFLTVIATSAITTVIISPIQATAYNDYSSLLSRVEMLESAQAQNTKSILLLYDIVERLEYEQDNIRMRLNK